MNKYISTYKIFEADEFRPPEFRNFKEKTELRHQLLNMDKKMFTDIYSKYKWYMVNNTKPLIKNNLFTLVNMAYDDLGGHVRINTPDAVVQDSDLNFWTAISVSNDKPYADAVIFGKKTKYGIKISGFGHNSQITSTHALVEHLVKLLNTNGYFIEASDKPAKILLNKNVPIVHDIDVINEIFGNRKDAIFTDPEHVWYIRTVNSKGDKSKEVLFGKPIV